MSENLPEIFRSRLQGIVPGEYFSQILSLFAQPDPVVVRVNTLKLASDTACSRLEGQGIPYERVGWNPDVLILKDPDKKTLSANSLFQQGALYFQNLSSLLPAMALAPKPGESVLDLCAAPGSKTTQMAAMMRNQGRITAVETVRARFYKLKAVCALLGVENVTFKLTDGRYLRILEDGLFDRVLVDAPCSSEGRFKTFEPKSMAYWSPRKIKETAHKQKGLLLNASRLLKPGGVLVYSTCTFAPEENEGVVDWVLRKAKGLSLQIVPVPSDVPRYPVLQEWQGRVFKADLSPCRRILPDGKMSGFFLACFCHVS